MSDAIDDEGVALQIPTAEIFLPLLEPRRFKGARGGRGAAKSHFVAERMIEDCATSHNRVACLREFQSSMAESVKQLLEDKIQTLGLEELFETTLTEIRGPYDSLIVFKGLQGNSAFSLKSLEGFSRAWVEEAQSISVRSLTTMTPTFRRTPGMTADPEMYFTWNPIAANDPIERLFADNKDDPDFVLVNCTYKDNPWFPDDLRRDMERDKRRDPDKYANVWLGAYESISESRVFRNYQIREFETHEDAQFRFGADWGFSVDPTVLVRCYIKDRFLFVDQEVYKVGCPIVQTPELFAQIPGSKRWPLRADSARPETIDHMRTHGFRNMTAAVKGKNSVNDGIEFLKSYDIVIHPRCVHTIDEMAKYSYKIDARTNEVLPILIDAENHCIAEGELVLCERGLVPIELVTVDDRVMTRAGLKAVLFSGKTGVARDVVSVVTTIGEVRCTPDHEIWSSKEFARADTLRYADEVLGFVSEDMKCPREFFGTVIDITDIRKTMMCILGGLSKELPNYFIGKCGSFIKDRFLKSTTSIMSMKTLRIMTLTISNALRRPNMAQSIRCKASAFKSSESILRESIISQSLGTVLRRVSQSIVRSARSLTSISCLCPSCVSIANVSFYQATSVIWTASAQMRASQPFVEQAVLMMKKGFALRAVSHLSSTVIKNPLLVRGHVLTVRESGKSDVYDLTVEDQHEFFVNGVLVSNCIDALRYAVEGERLAPKPIVIPKAAMQRARIPVMRRYIQGPGR